LTGGETKEEKKEEEKNVIRRGNLYGWRKQLAHTHPSLVT
jgi:hypothetical protein